MTAACGYLHTAQIELKHVGGGGLDEDGGEQPRASLHLDDTREGCGSSPPWHITASETGFGEPDRSMTLCGLCCIYTVYFDRDYICLYVHLYLYLDLDRYLDI